MKVIFKFFITSTLLIFSLTDNLAQQDSIVISAYYDFVVDSSQSEVRQFDTTELYLYKLQSEYNYDNDPEYNTDFWSYIKDLFIKFIEETFGENGADTFWGLFYISVSIIGLIILVYTVFKMKGSSLIQKEARDKEILIETIDDNLSTEKLDSLLKISLEQGNFRAAVRIHFIKTLRILDQKGIVKWKEFKTNTDFTNEIVSSSLKILFKDITWVYENIWYGEFPIDKDYYKKFAINLDDFYTKINEN